MSITIKPLPLIFVVLAVVLWLFKPQNAVIAAPVVAHRVVPSPDQMIGKLRKQGNTIIRETVNGYSTNR